MIPRFVWLIVIMVTGQSMTPSAGMAESTRTSLFPKLHAGQTFTYLIQYRSKKNVKTESRVFTPLGPQNDQTDSQWLLHVEILDVHPQGTKAQGTRAAIHARSQFQSVDSTLPLNSNDKSTDKQRPPSAESKPVEFTILPNGRADAVKGLDLLFPEQRQVWQQWLRQFAIAAVFPREGVKLGESWRSTEIEEAPSPIAKLQWEKSESYVRDEPCFPVQISDAGVATPKNSQHETCAVVLTHAVLKQKSSPKDTTPVDYKLHALHTSGTASGTNETISYIDLQSGLVVRVTEDAKQFMDVVIAKTDESNKIHYNVNAASHTELLLVAPAAPSKP
ncbi:MAG TPA: hypothetical protein VGH83_06795 [Candidatus Acidoferrum sp.]|jgi:hypothetical protein